MTLRVREMVGRAFIGCLVLISIPAAMLMLGLVAHILDEHFFNGPNVVCVQVRGGEVCGERTS